MRVCDNVETMLAFHGAPTLEGIKPGSLISFNKQRIKNCHLILKRYKKCMECKGIRFFIISETDNWLLLFIYRQNALNQVIQEDKVQEFLSFYGYVNFKNLNQCLNYLKTRMSLQKGFPHEIGIFLGYPLEDVKGFIENSGRHFKICGQWKVYSDTKRAEKLFAKYAEMFYLCPIIIERMNRLLVTYGTDCVLRGKAPCCGSFMVCVHWFSGFI